MGVAKDVYLEKFGLDPKSFSVMAPRPTGVSIVSIDSLVGIRWLGRLLAARFTNLLRE